MSKKNQLSNFRGYDWISIKIYCTLLLVFFIGLHNLSAQVPEIIKVDPIICPGNFEDMHSRMGMRDIIPLGLHQRKAAAPTAQFQITFGPGALANPDAKAAFEFALSIWANELVSTVPIRVFADFASLGPRTLASAGPSYLASNFEGAPQPDTVYPAALANSLAGKVIMPNEKYDLVVNLGNSIPWYFGTDGNTPEGLFDFVSIALHEIGHGLGFVTVRGYVNGRGTLKDPRTGFPAIYSSFMVQGDGTRLLDIEDSSIAMGNAFTSNDLYADGIYAKAALGGTLPKLYAPSSFALGSSLAHWDEETYPPGDPNSLMSPRFGRSESNFDIGAITRGHFKDMGWTLNDESTPPIVVTPREFSEIIAPEEPVIKEITISNITDSPINLTAVLNAGDSVIEFPKGNTLTIPALDFATLEFQINNREAVKRTLEEIITLNIEGRENIIEVPVNIRLLDGTENPVISTDVTTFTEQLDQQDIINREFEISNLGDLDLNYSIVTSGFPNGFSISVTPESGTIAMGDKSVVQLEFKAQSSELGVFDAKITINSDDKTNPSFTIPVSLTVTKPATILLTPNALNVAVDLQIDNPPVKTTSFVITNTGESALNFRSTLLEGLTLADPEATNANALLTSDLDMTAYGLDHTYNGYQPQISPDVSAALAMVKKSPSLEKAIAFTDSIYYDSGRDSPNQFIGSGPGTSTTQPYAAATRFEVDRDFTLSAVTNGYLIFAPIILEIYKGGQIPEDGGLILNDDDLLLRQVINQEPEDFEIVIKEILHTELNFAAGESFWIVHKYPSGTAPGNDFPQGIDLDAPFRSETYYFSGDDEFYFEIPDAFFVRALSDGENNNPIVLEPSSGSIAPGETREITVDFDGTSFANGTHTGDVSIFSNDPLTPEAFLPITFEVSGQKNSIITSDELLIFDNAFIGGSQKRTFTIKNIDLQAVNIVSISSDNENFIVNRFNPNPIRGGEELEITIDFVPSAIGSFNGIITIASNAGATPVLEVVVSGTGIEPPIANLPQEKILVTADARTIVEKEIILKNDGNAPLLYSFPELAVANALIKPDVKLNNTAFIEFEDFDAKKEGVIDNRIGSAVFANIGKDNSFGYTWIDSDEVGGPVYNFEDISASGIDITKEAKNTISAEVPLPFPFDFYGGTYNTIFIDKNGVLLFKRQSSFQNLQIPDPKEPNNIIAPFWDFLKPQDNGGSSLHYQSFTDRFIVQWTAYNRVTGLFERDKPDEQLTFQAVLYSNGNIDFLYEDVESVSVLNSNTIGIENADGTDGAQVAFNTNYVKNGLAIRFIKPELQFAKFITTVNPISGVVPANGSRKLTVTIDTGVLNNGIYAEELTVSSNSIDKSTSSSLFLLNVIGKPKIEIDPELVKFEPLFIGLKEESDILIKNVGSKELEITERTNDNTDFVIRAKLPVTLLPGESLTVKVKFTPTTSGAIQDNLVIISNDAFGNDSISIPLSGIGVLPPIIEVSPETIDVTLKEGQSATELVTIKNAGPTLLEYSFTKSQLINSQNENGKPDKYGYTWLDSNTGGSAYDYIDISSTGTKANLDSDNFITVPLPFDFKFYGESQNEVLISSNGFLSFDPILRPGATFINPRIPSTRNENLFIAPLWDDLAPEKGEGVFYQGTDEYFIVQYKEIPGFGTSNPAAPVSFQVILFPDGSIKMQYLNVDSTTRTGSTVGIEGLDGLSGLQIARNQEYLTNQLAITITPPINGAGTLEAGEMVEIPVEISAEGLESGQTYKSNFVIQSNAVNRPEVIVPITLEILDVPRVTSFTLFNAETDQEIGTLKEGDVIDIRDFEVVDSKINSFNIVANIGAVNVGSVVFDLNNKNGFRTENVAPFALGGDTNGNFASVSFPLGKNTVTATPYAGSNASGEKGKALTVAFEVIDSAAPIVTDFTLINANTNEEIGSLKEGNIINLDDYEINSFNIVAETGENDVRVVVFDFNGVKNFRKESTAPYALNGDFNGVFKALEFPIGMNTVTATPSVISSQPGKSLTVNFEVLAKTNSSLAKTTKVSLGKLFPNPVETIAHFSILNTEDKVVHATMANLLGHTIYNTSDFNIDEQGNGTIDMTNLAKGIYILTIKDDNFETLLQAKVLKK